MAPPQRGAWSIRWQPDTNIYVGGSFYRANMAKFNGNGAVNTGWRVNVGGGGIWDLVLSTDKERVIFGGLFNRVNAVSRPGIAMVSASNVGALTPAFPNWQSVAAYCYAGYPGCIFVYDLDVQNGKLLVSGAEHFSSLPDDSTGQRTRLWRETNDTQAGLLDGDRVWRTRHGNNNTTGMYYAHDLKTNLPLITTINRVATGAGDFEIEKGENDCVWIGGTIGAMDLATSPGSNKVATYHVGFMCPHGTVVPASQLNIDNWDVDPGLVIRQFRLVEKGCTFGVHAYTPAPDAVTHQVFLDGNLIGRDTDGSFTDTLDGSTYTYEIVERIGAQFGRVSDCGDIETPPPPPPALLCEVSAVNGDAVVSWTGQNAGADSVIVFRTPQGQGTFWRGKVDAAATGFTDSLRPATFDYEIRERTGAINADPVSCGTVQG